MMSEALRDYLRRYIERLLKPMRMDGVVVEIEYREDDSCYGDASREYGKLRITFTQLFVEADAKTKRETIIHELGHFFTEDARATLDKAIEGAAKKHSVELLQSLVEHELDQVNEHFAQIIAPFFPPWEGPNA